MRFIAGATTAPVDITDFYTVTTVPRPTIDAALYRIVIRFSGLSLSTANLLVQQKFGSNAYNQPLTASSGVASVSIDVELPTTGLDCQIRVIDGDAASTAAILSWVLYRIDDDQVGQPDAYLVPKDSTTVPLVFRMGHSAPALSPTVKLQKNGAGGFVDAAGMVSSLGNGWFKLDPAASDTSTEGPLILEATLGTTTGAVKARGVYQVFSSADNTIPAATLALLLPYFAQVLSAVQGGDSPPGAVQYIIHVQDNSSQAIDGAEVWVSNDADGDDVVDGVRQTNTNGDATFLLDPGTYYAWAEKGGKQHIAGQQITVA